MNFKGDINLLLCVAASRGRTCDWITIYVQAADMRKLLTIKRKQEFCRYHIQYPDSRRSWLCLLNS